MVFPLQIVHASLSEYHQKLQLLFIKYKTMPRPQDEDKVSAMKAIVNLFLGFNLAHFLTAHEIRLLFHKVGVDELLNPKDVSDAIGRYHNNRIQKESWGKNKQFYFLSQEEIENAVCAKARKATFDIEELKLAKDDQRQDNVSRCFHC